WVGRRRAPRAPRSLDHVRDDGLEQRLLSMLARVPVARTRYPRSVRALVLSLFLTVTASAAQWPADYDAALAKARAEKRVLLVYFRSSCGICNKPTDSALKEAETHEPITAMYESFVRVRVNDGAVVGELAKLIAQDPPAPSLLFVDPGGTIARVFRKVDNANTYLSALTVAAENTQNIVNIAALRGAGKRAEADHLHGVVLLHLNALPEARD